jgi:O-antigen ligase
MCFIFLLGEEWINNLKKNYKTLVLVSLSGIFIIYLISIFNSENLNEYFNVFKNKIPYLFIGFSIVTTGKIDKKPLKITKYVFIVCAVLSSFWSYLQYYKNTDYYTHLYTKGEVIPTLIHHISFSLLLCIAVLFILQHLQEAVSKFEKITYCLLLIWLVYYIHILSVRSGIVLLYLSILLFVLHNLFTQKKKWFAAGLLLFIFLSAYYSYEFIPSIKNKIGYTVYGLNQLKTNSDSTNQISDTRRILSDKIGLEIIKKNLFFGTGFGDIKAEMNQIYKSRYPAFDKAVYSRIHNQYLYVMAGAGIISGIIFCILLLLPMISFIKNKNVVFTISYLMILILMFWESFIENQLGTSIFLWVCCMGYVQKQDE